MLREAITTTLDALLTACWRVYGFTLCKHDWRKDDIETRRSTHPLVRQKEMFVKGFCVNCGRRKWLMR